uniref:OBG-type G domain-containing protein n=1 Tax=Ditylum brightwellii TaxID=49249 RepID=A0A7S4T5M4_9STRA
MKQRRRNNDTTNNTIGNAASKLFDSPSRKRVIIEILVPLFVVAVILLPTKATSATTAGFVGCPSVRRCPVPNTKQSIYGVHLPFGECTKKNDKKLRIFSQIEDEIDEKNDETKDDDGEVYFSPNIALSSSSSSTEEEEGEVKVDKTKSGSTNEYSFFDEAQIYVRAGSGGQGSSTYKLVGPTNQNGPPDGGNGGDGGGVYVTVDPSLNTLAGLTNAWRPNAFGGGGAAKGRRNAKSIVSFRAENGHDGGRRFKTGKNGQDVFVKVPPGTLVQQQIEIHTSTDDDGAPPRTKLVTLGTVTSDTTPTICVAQGGTGGEGSSAGGKAGRGVKRTRLPPTAGDRKVLMLTLKVVADVALVGVPNAGKSTFLAAVTRAKPKIANYPFTTVVPNLGVWVPPMYNTNDDNKAVEIGGAGSTGLVLCDVPGLVSGASSGAGLGHAFLRHVERCRVILHLVDATSNDPVADFNMLNQEIMKYGNGKLALMPQIVVVNKVDVWEEKQQKKEQEKEGSSSLEEWEQGLKTRMKREELEEQLRGVMTHSRLMWMSAKGGNGVDDLMGRMAAFVQKVKEVDSQQS